MRLTVFPDLKQIQNARDRSREALGLGADSPLTALAANVFLKYLLLEGLDNGEIRYWRSCWRNDAGGGLRKRLETLLSDMLAGMSTVENLPEREWMLLPAVPRYRQRLLGLALEAVLSEPLAPELCLQPNPAPAHAFPTIPPASHQHAILFASAVFFIHEFYPLAVDAYAHDCERHGEQRIQVFGAHIDWLAGNGALRRVIYLDVASGRLIETDLDLPMQADSVQFLCLGKQERALHAALSQRFNCSQVNPVSAASLADNKAATLAAWLDLGLTVPEWQMIAPGNWEAAFCFLDRYAEIVV